MIISTFFDIATLHVAWQCQVTAVSVLKSMVFCVGKKKTFRTHKVAHWDDGHRFFLSASIATCMVKGPGHDFQRKNSSRGAPSVIWVRRGFPQKCDGNLIHKLRVTFEGSLHVPSQR